MSWTPALPHVDAIVTLVMAERPDWEEALTRYILLDLARRVDGLDLARAALAAAANPDLPGPKSIGWRGPHWRGLNSCPPELAAPLICQICGRPEPECWGVRFGADDHDFEPGHSRARHLPTQKRRGGVH